MGQCLSMCIYKIQFETWPCKNQYIIIYFCIFCLPHVDVCTTISYSLPPVQRKHLKVDGYYVYIYTYMYDNIISYQWFRYINNINIDNRFSQVIDSTRFHWNTIQQSCSWQDLRSIALFSNLSDCKVWGFSGLQFNHVSLTWDNPLGSMGLHISLHEWKIFMVHVGKYTNSTHLKNII